jgi:hypothetical protein
LAGHSWAVDTVPELGKVSEDAFGAGAANGFSNFMVTSGGNLYVVGQGGTGSPGFLFKTADGATWEEVNGPGWSPVGSAAGAYWATVFQEKMYVGFHHGDRPGSLWLID